MSTLRDIAREAIERDGRTLPAIARAAGIDRALLWRFVTGRRDCTTGTLDALLRGLGLRLTVKRKRGRK
ncbi:MAG: helix-turn-helix domain-containing protein [Planctomycetota bacterium]